MLSGNPKLCSSATELTPGTWNTEVRAVNVTQAFQPLRCAPQFAHAGSQRLCAALLARNVTRILYFGDSTVADLFVATTHEVIPPWPGTLDTPVHAQSVLEAQHNFVSLHPELIASDIFGVRRRNTSLRIAFQDAVAFCHLRRNSFKTSHSESLPSGADTPCTFVRRCGGLLEMLYYYIEPEERFLSGLFRALRNASVAGTAPDSFIWSIGQHYMPAGTFAIAMGDGRFHQANHTNAMFGQHLRLIAESIATYSARRSKDGGSLFFNMLRPAPALKTARWKIQDVAAAASLNDVAQSALQNTPIWDGFEFTRGVEISHSRDGTHYDHIALTAQGALLLEALAHSLVRNQFMPSERGHHPRGDGRGGRVM